jgi:hypothetical protein
VCDETNNVAIRLGSNVDVVVVVAVIVIVVVVTVRAIVVVVVAVVIVSVVDDNRGPKSDVLSPHN